MSLLAFMASWVVGDHNVHAIGTPCLSASPCLHAIILLPEPRPDCHPLASVLQSHSLDVRAVASAYAQHTVCAVWLAAQLVNIFTNPWDVEDLTIENFCFLGTPSSLASSPPFRVE